MDKITEEFKRELIEDAKELNQRGYDISITKLTDEELLTAVADAHVEEFQARYYENKLE